MTITLPTIAFGAPGEEISKKDLIEVVERFKRFNLARLNRVQQFLQGRQQDFLQLLPLLFHINHPLLPGFISLETPAGIPDYQPPFQTLEVARQFTKGFAYKRQLLRDHPIHGLYLMGSVGSMAFSKDSDIDIWLCHQPTMALDDVDVLQQKAQAIEKWAASLKIEVHFFLVDSEQFKRGENTPISAESSGEAQHYLLLEEFYRTAIYIAGRVPLWWLIPPNQELAYDHYAQHLLEKRFVAASEVIDFGGLQGMPVNEFVSATLWQIFKSLSSPHKSLLKLLLMESYASEFPNPQWLCMQIKQAIYRGAIDVDQLDAYLLIYSKVDRYLQQSESSERLQLARECFHLKIMGASDAALDKRERAIHAGYLKSIAQQWQWPAGLLERLGSGQYWDIEKANDEHRVIREHLQHSMRMILTFAGNPLEQASAQSNDITWLSRKLHAALDLRPGKVDILTTRSRLQLIPTVLTLVETRQPEAPFVWSVYADNQTGCKTIADAPLKQADTLLEVLCWLVVNGLYQKNRNLKLMASHCALTELEISQMAAEVQTFLNQHGLDGDEDLALFEQANSRIATLLVVNSGETLAMDASSQQLVLSERSDPFSYGDLRLSLIQSLQTVSVSRWGEVSVQHYQGLDGLFSGIVELFNASEWPLLTDSHRVLCFTRARGHSIVMRIEQLLKQLATDFTQANSAPDLRHCLAAEKGVALFYCQDRLLHYQRLDNQKQLMQALAAAQPRFSPLTFDDWVLEKTVIPSLYRHNLAATVQVFYVAGRQKITVYVLDEKGALFCAEHRQAFPEQLLIHYAVFLSSLLAQAKLPAAQAIQCYQVLKPAGKAVVCKPLQLRALNSTLALRVRFTADQAGKTFTVYCNELAFSLVDAEAFKALKAHIVSFRSSHDDYPCHITEIDVPCRLLGISHDNQAQAVHYLRYKQQMEQRLNFT